jgi:hypothetical protein
MSADGLARLLIIAGLIILITGIIIYLIGRLGISFGKLPGDLRFETGSLTCVFPLATSIILSIVLTVVLNLILRGMNK